MVIIKDKPNIVLIVLDTAAVDVLNAALQNFEGQYIHKLINNSTQYYNAISPSSWTLPSHASIFTGKYPGNHRIHETYELKASKISQMMKEHSGNTITKYLYGMGYDTIGYSANSIISPDSGFDNYFRYFTLQDSLYGVKEELDEILTFTDDLKTDFNLEGKLSTMKLVSELLKSRKFKEFNKLVRLYYGINKKLKYEGFPMMKGGNYIARNISQSSFEEPFFLFINLMEMHDPYILNNMRRFTFDTNNVMLDDLFGYHILEPNVLKRIRAGYDSSAHVLLGYVEKILAALYQKTSLDNTMVIITSDHGQDIKYENFYGHGIFLNDKLTKVPLILHYPNASKINSNRKIDSLVSTVNIFDSIVNLVENNTEEQFGSEVVFSETFGIQHDIEFYFKDKLQDSYFMETRDKLDVVRKRIHKGNFSLTVNVTDGITESFKYAAAEISPSSRPREYNDLLQEIEFFLGKNKYYLPNFLKYTS